MIRAGLFAICFVLLFALVPLVSSQSPPPPRKSAVEM